MQKLPKKVETALVIKFFNEVLDEKFGAFEQKIDEKLDQKLSAFEKHVDEKLEQRLNTFEKRIDEKFDQKFGELSQKVDLIGSLIANTHQEVKHFVEMHKLLDEKVADLERRLSHVEHLVKHQQA